MDLKYNVGSATCYYTIPVHKDYVDDVRWYLYSGADEEVDVGVPAQVRDVQREAVVSPAVHEPVEEQVERPTPQIGASSKQAQEVDS